MGWIRCVAMRALFVVASAFFFAYVELASGTGTRLWRGERSTRTRQRVGCTGPMSARQADGQQGRCVFQRLQGMRFTPAQVNEVTRPHLLLRRRSAKQ